MNFLNKLRVNVLKMLEVEDQQLTANCTCNKIFKDFLTLGIQNFSSESKLTASFYQPLLFGPVSANYNSIFFAHFLKLKNFIFVFVACS